jgi:hypothetical protein
MKSEVLKQVQADMARDEELSKLRAAEKYDRMVQADKQYDRLEILTKAHDLTAGDRAKDYGPVTDNMRGIANFWNALLESKWTAWRRAMQEYTPDYIGEQLPPGLRLSGEDACYMMQMLKIQRSLNVPGEPHWDSHFDNAAYAAMAGECAGEERQ